MGLFILRRLGVMLLTALCLTFIVFWLTNLYPNLEKLAKTQGNFRMSDEAVASYLESRGYLQPTVDKFGEWLGVLPGCPYIRSGSAPRFCVSAFSIRASTARTKLSLFRYGAWLMSPFSSSWAARHTSRSASLAGPTLLL